MNMEQGISIEELANCIDHTLLSATATSEQVRQLCEEAISYGFHTVSVNGRWVAPAAAVDDARRDRLLSIPPARRALRN